MKAQDETLPDKPIPAKFCWDCGRKLRGKYFYQALVDGYWRTMHKACAEAMPIGREERAGLVVQRYDGNNTKGNVRL